MFFGLIVICVTVYCIVDRVLTHIEKLEKSK